MLLVCLAAAGCGAQHPSTDDGQASPAASPAVEATPSAPPRSDGPPAKPRISRAALNYFVEVALGAEYGDDDPVITKWTKAVVTVRTEGEVSAASRDCLQRVVTDFNALTATTDLKLTTDPVADIEMHFAPVTRFPSIEPEYVRGHDGFSYARWLADRTITNAVVLIRTAGITIPVRCHHIREQLTRSMGLLRDSNDYPTSIFYGRWSATTQYSAIDRKVIALLYSGALKPGYTRKMVVDAVTVG